MDKRDNEKIEFTRRNEKNKIWQRRIKTYYLVAWGTLLLEILMALFIKSGGMILLYVMGVLFVAWIIWVVVGFFVLPCPHCGSAISHLTMRINCCPYCGTNLNVFPDLELSEDRE